MINKKNLLSIDIRLGTKSLETDEELCKTIKINQRRYLSPLITKKEEIKARIQPNKSTSNQGIKYYKGQINFQRIRNSKLLYFRSFNSQEYELRTKTRNTAWLI